MVRGFGFLAGLGFVAAVLWSLMWGVISYVGSPPEQTVEERLHEEPRNISYSFNGPFGRYDLQQLQRGFQVFKEVCSACHSLTHVAFRDLRQIGYSEAEVRAIADQWQIQVPSINPDTGEPATRKAIPADHFPSPYANETAARQANNNALPPDLSLMTKAREGGPAYVYSILTGYANQQGYKNDKGVELLKTFPDAKTPPNLHFNPYFANLNIAMPPPLHGGDVTFADGSPNDLAHEARDVAAFLVWTAEPSLARRHAAGLAVSVFLLFATVLGYFAYQNIWAETK